MQLIKYHNYYYTSPTQAGIKKLHGKLNDSQKMNVYCMDWRHIGKPRVSQRVIKYRENEWCTISFPNCIYGSPKQYMKYIAYNTSFELFYSRLNFVVHILFSHCTNTLYKWFKILPKVLQNFERVIYTSDLLYQK